MALDPHGLLAQVHPHLVQVLVHAAQSPQPFQVIYGIRTEAAQAHALATGHSETTHSRHLPQSLENMKACAVDLAALIDGKVSFAPKREAELFGQINRQIQAAAVIFGIPVAWGGQEVGAWVDGVVSHYRDWDHWQLPKSRYP